MPHDHHHSFIHHDSIDYKELATHPKTMVYGQADDETIVNSWFSDDTLRSQYNTGVISKFPKLPGHIQKMGVDGGTICIVVVLEDNESALYKVAVPEAGHETRLSFNDHMGVNGLWLRKWGTASYAYRVCDNPEKATIRIDTEERALTDAQPIAIHRFCVIHYKKHKSTHAMIKRLSANTILVEHNEASELACSESEWMFPSPVSTVDDSPVVVILTIGGNLIFVDVDTLTVNIIKKKYESAGIRAIFKNVNSFRRIVNVCGDSIVVEADVIAGSSAHSTSFKVFKARLPQKYREIRKRVESKTKVSVDTDPVQLVRYVQYLMQCSECGEQECKFTVRSFERDNHQKNNFDKKKKGMENSFAEITDKLNERFQVKKAELFSKSSAPPEYCSLWGEFVSRRLLAKQEFDEAMHLMEVARRQMQ